MMTLGDLCDFVAGRVPLLIELKSRFDGDLRLAKRAAEVVKTYTGPAALMSFDPAPIAALREFAPEISRGIVAERHYDHGMARSLARQKRSLPLLLHLPRSRPHFVAYHVKDLPSPGPWIARHILGLHC